VAWALDELEQKRGTAGCVSETESRAVAIFDRDPETEALTQKPGTAGCMAAGRHREPVIAQPA
jgi:hypothetical protein